MSLTKDGFDNIEGQMFEVIRGVEGDCLTLGDEDGGTRISGPKPWGGGQVVKTFVTCEKYGPIEHLEAENEKLWELLADAMPLIWLGNVDCSGCIHMRECYAGEATDFAPENCRLVVRARELGVEVSA